MRKFNVTVNGNTYEVEVEEIVGGKESTQVKTTPTPKVSAPKKAASNVAAGGTKVTAPMSGKIIDIKVTEGQVVSEGNVVAILESMKMENEIVAPTSGKVASINVNKGASIESGDIIITIG